MSENSNDNKENRNLKKCLKALNAPYKKSKAYETFGDVKSSNNESSVFWNSKVDYVVKYENAKIDNPQTEDMGESEDKNIPLMEPTFFASDDFNNPKYVSLEEKKKNLELKKNQRQNIYSKYKKRAALVSIPSFLFTFSVFVCFLIKYGSLINDFHLMLSLIPQATVIFAPTAIISFRGYKVDKKISKEIKDLEQEIEEEIKIKKQEKKSGFKKKVASLSEETKKVLNDISKDEELKETRKAFGKNF